MRFALGLVALVACNKPAARAAEPVPLATTRIVAADAATDTRTPDVIDARIVRVEVVGSYQMVFIDRGLRDGITAQWKACLVSRDERCLDVPITLVGVDEQQAGVRVDASLTDLNVKPIVRLRRP